MLSNAGYQRGHTAVDASDKVVSIIASDNYKAGVECAKDMMSKLDEGSKIAVMDEPSGTACVQREQGFLDTVGDYFENGIYNRYRR